MGTRDDKKSRVAFHAHAFSGLGARPRHLGRLKDAKKPEDITDGADSANHESTSFTKTEKDSVTTESKVQNADKKERKVSGSHDPSADSKISKSDKSSDNKSPNVQQSHSASELRDKPPVDSSGSHRETRIDNKPRHKSDSAPLRPDSKANHQSKRTPPPSKSSVSGDASEPRTNSNHHSRRNRHSPDKRHGNSERRDTHNQDRLSGTHDEKKNAKHATEKRKDVKTTENTENAQPAVVKITSSNLSAVKPESVSHGAGKPDPGRSREHGSEQSREPKQTPTKKKASKHREQRDWNSSTEDLTVEPSTHRRRKPSGRKKHRSGRRESESKSESKPESEANRCAVGIQSLTLNEKTSEPVKPKPEPEKHRTDAPKVDDRTVDTKNRSPGAVAKGPKPKPADDRSHKEPRHKPTPKSPRDESSPGQSRPYERNWIINSRTNRADREKALPISKPGGDNESFHNNSDLVSTRNSEPKPDVTDEVTASALPSSRSRGRRSPIGAANEPVNTKATSSASVNSQGPSPVPVNSQGPIPEPVSSQGAIPESLDNKAPSPEPLNSNQPTDSLCDQFSEKASVSEEMNSASLVPRGVVRGQAIPHGGRGRGRAKRPPANENSAGNNDGPVAGKRKDNEAPTPSSRRFCNENREPTNQSSHYGENHQRQNVRHRRPPLLPTPSEPNPVQTLVFENSLYKSMQTPPPRSPDVGYDPSQTFELNNRSRVPVNQNSDYADSRTFQLRNTRQVSHNGNSNSRMSPVGVQNRTPSPQLNSAMVAPPSRVYREMGQDSRVVHTNDQQEDWTLVGTDMNRTFQQSMYTQRPPPPPSEPYPDEQADQRYVVQQSQFHDQQRMYQQMYNDEFSHQAHEGRVVYYQQQQREQMPQQQQQVWRQDGHTWQQGQQWEVQSRSESVPTWSNWVTEQQNNHQQLQHGGHWQRPHWDDRRQRPQRGPPPRFARPTSPVNFRSPSPTQQNMGASDHVFRVPNPVPSVTKPPYGRGRGRLVKRPPAAEAPPTFTQPRIVQSEQSNIEPSNRVSATSPLLPEYADDHSNSTERKVVDSSVDNETNLPDSESRTVVSNQGKDYTENACRQDIQFIHGTTRNKATMEGADSLEDVRFVVDDRFGPESDFEPAEELETCCQDQDFEPREAADERTNEYGHVNSPVTDEAISRTLAEHGFDPFSPPPRKPEPKTTRKPDVVSGRDDVTDHVTKDGAETSDGESSGGEDNETAGETCFASAEDSDTDSRAYLSANEFSSPLQRPTPDFNRKVKLSPKAQLSPKDSPEMVKHYRVLTRKDAISPQVAADSPERTSSASIDDVTKAGGDLASEQPKGKRLSGPPGFSPMAAIEEQQSDQQQSEQPEQHQQAFSEHQLEQNSSPAPPPGFTANDKHKIDYENRRKSAPPVVETANYIHPILGRNASTNEQNDEVEEGEIPEVTPKPRPKVLSKFVTLSSKTYTPQNKSITSAAGSKSAPNVKTTWGTWSTNQQYSTPTTSSNSVGYAAQSPEYYKTTPPPAVPRLYDANFPSLMAAGIKPKTKPDSEPSAPKPRLISNQADFPWVPASMTSSQQKLSFTKTVQRRSWGSCGQREYPNLIKSDQSPSRFYSSSSTENLSDFPRESPQRDWRVTHRTRLDSSDIPYIDSHCHIDFIFTRSKYPGTWTTYQQDYADTFMKNYAGCVTNFCEPSVYRINNPTWTQILSEDKVWAAFGCHPKSVGSFTPEREMFLRHIMSNPKVVALGEIGLDYSGRFGETAEQQKEAFIKQLEIALRFQKPLVIHCREAEHDCLEIMKKYVPHDYVIHRHCFTEDWETATPWMDYFTNCYLGLTPLVTYRRAEKTHEVARSVPLNRLLLETDSPYFIPTYISKSVLPYNSPGLAISVADEVASLRGCTMDDVLRHTRHNTTKMYAI